MTKAVSQRSHWKPARWTPKMGALPLGLSNVPGESVLGAGGGLVFGLIAGDAMGRAINLSASAATALLATISIGIPLLLGPKNISRQTSNILYGVGVGLGAASVLRIVQSFFVPPPPPVTTP